MTTGADWAEQARRLLEAVSSAAATESDDASGECRWCPHCQLLAVLRGERPEVTAVLSDVLATASAALRSFAEEAPAAAPDRPEDEPAHRDPAPTVQRIEIA
jgi:hypothetical protein